MRRIQRIGGFAIASAIAQAASLLAGILVVRALGKDQYAQYSIFLSTVGMLGLLTSSGVNSVILASAGRALSTGLPIAPIFRGANRVRRWMILAFLLPAATLAAILWKANGATWAETVLLVVFLAGTCWSALVASIYRLAIQVYGRYDTIKWLDLPLSAARTGLTSLLFVAGVMWAPWFAAIAALIAVADGLATWIIATRDARWGNGEESPAPSSPFIRALRQTLPANVALVAGEQLVMILITMSGNTPAIAEISALSRFAAAFVVVNSVVSNIVAPTLSRTAHDRSRIGKQATQAVLVYFALSVAYVAAVSLFSPQLLWLLGADYAGLSVHLLVITCGTAIANFAMYGLGAVTYGLGWTKLTWTFIPLLGLWLVFGMFLDLSNSLQAVIFAASLSLVSLVSQVIRVVYGALSTSRSWRVTEGS